MNNRHRLAYKLERKEKRRQVKELNNLWEERFEPGFLDNPIVSLEFPGLPNEKYAFSLRGAKK